MAFSGEPWYIWNRDVRFCCGCHTLGLLSAFFLQNISPFFGILVFLSYLCTAIRFLLTLLGRIVVVADKAIASGKTMIAHYDDVFDISKWYV